MKEEGEEEEKEEGEREDEEEKENEEEEEEEGNKEGGDEKDFLHRECKGFDRVTAAIETREGLRKPDSTFRSKVVCSSQRPPRLGGVSRQSIP